MTISKGPQGRLQTHWLPTLAQKPIACFAVSCPWPGNAERIGHFIEAAMRGYRDVIYWAEYDESDRRVHDFTSPFAA